MKFKSILPPSPTFAIGRQAMILLGTGFIIIVIRHGFFIPIWATIAALGIAVWRLRIDTRKASLPGKIVRNTLTLAAFFGVYITFGAVLGRDPGVTALVLLASLKLLELKSSRDFLFEIFLCHFLLLALFLFSDSLLTLLFVVVMFTYFTAVVLSLNRDSRFGLSIFSYIRSAMKFMGVALPFVLILFFFFPRTSISLWNLSNEGDRGVSGLKRYIQPGDVAKVAKSKKTAFRVMFPQGNLPMHKDRYFRCLVLWFTNGVGFFQGTFYFRPHSYDGDSRDLIEQEIVLEPHYENWLVALDVPVKMPYWAGRIPGDVYQIRNKLKNYLSYRAGSLPRLNDTGDLREVLRRWALQLPRQMDPQLVSLARSLVAGLTDNRAKADAVMNFFRSEDFRYTLEPGKLDDERPISDFLFNTKKGFCEHYATACAILMRAAGVPCRVVAGYQGGKYNPVGGYLSVSQADAHAWTEVWIPGSGWRRRDPTAMVLPERIEYGLDVALAVSAVSILDGAARSETVRARLKKSFFTRLKETVLNHWDNINTQWNRWVIGFDRFQQRDLLKRLNLDFLHGSWLLMVLAVVLVMIFFLFYGLIRRGHRTMDPLLATYQRFCLKLAKRGLDRLNWEGPLDFKKRVSERFPHLKPDITYIINAYVAMRYAGVKTSRQNLARFARAVRKFRC